MITKSFHKDSEPIIKIENVLQKNETVLDACIINFSWKIMSALIEDGHVELVSEDSIKSASQRYPVYRFKNSSIGIVLTSVGAPITAGLIEEIGHVFSCDKFLLFGSCGTLDKSIPPKYLIVPTEAYRDEGTSYHYVEPSDYIKIKNHNVVSNIFDELGIEYVKGKTWTTDAFYRETQEEMLLRKGEGCIAVEMEISACQAVADYKNVDFYAFLYRGDNLDASNWEKGFTSKMSKNQNLQILSIALEIAKKVIE